LLPQWFAIVVEYIVFLVKEANRVSPDKKSVFRVARKHHVLPCQIERCRKQFEKNDATISNNDDYEESQEVIHDSQSWYSNNNNVVDCSLLSCPNKNITIVLPLKI
jgi:hypothetical protein